MPFLNVGNEKVLYTVSGPQINHFSFDFGHCITTTQHVTPTVMNTANELV